MTHPENDLRDAVARAEGRIAELMRQVFVPGMLKCAKCGFVLISANLNAQDGTVTARDTTEHCPNDGAPMWRVSEREAGNDMADRAEEQMRRAIAAEADIAKARADLERVTAELDEADRRAGTAERRHADGLDTRLRADQWKRHRKAERGYHDNVSFDRVWAETCALADRARTAEAEATRLRALLVDAGEALKPFAEEAADYDPDDGDGDGMLWAAARIRIKYLRRARDTIAALDKAPTPKEPA